MLDIQERNLEKSKERDENSEAKGRRGRIADVDE